MTMAQICRNNGTRLRRLCMVVPLLARSGMFTKATPRRHLASRSTKLSATSLSMKSLRNSPNKDSVSTALVATSHHFLSTRGGGGEGGNKIEEKTQSLSAIGSVTVAATMTTTPTNAKNAVSPDFGGANGATIVNKNSILKEIDEALGLKRPPDLEVPVYIYIYDMLYLLVVCMLQLYIFIHLQ